MNDENIIKGLKCCGFGGCTPEECPYYSVKNCSERNAEDIIDLINRQIAEIERLSAENEILRNEIAELLKKAPEGEKTMTERERLYELIVDADNEFYREMPYGTAQERIEKTVEHLIKNGVIMPPVTVGQTVYFMHDDEIFEAKVIFIEINLFTNPRLWISLEYYSPIFGTCEYKSRVDLMLGKSVFLTREEAEAELERRRKEVKNE